MKTKFTILVMGMLLCIPIFTHSFTWTQKASFNPGNRYGAFSFSIGNFGYVGSGSHQTSGSYTLINDFWEYDPVADSWTQKASIPGSGRIGGSTFTVGNKGYVTTGYDFTSYLDDLWSYDLVLNTWVQLADFPGGKRYSCASFSINEYGFVGMGKTIGYYSDFFRYNVMNDTWTTISPIPGTPRQSAKGFTIDGYGFVVGGAEEFLQYDCKSAYRYEPIGDTWTQVADYPGNGSHGLACFVINDLAYIGTGTLLGSSMNNVYNDLYSYDYFSNTWTQQASFTGGVRQGSVSMEIGNKGYIGMGSTVIFPLLDYKTDWWTFEDPVGINDEPNSANANVFIDDQLYLNFEFSGASDQKQSISIFNSAGQLVKSVSLPAGNLKAVIELNGLSSGVYHYRVAGANKQISGKVTFTR